MAGPLWVICGLAGTALLAGCASITPVSTDLATTGPANPELALQTSLGKVRSAMYELNGMGFAPAVAQRPIVPVELNRPIHFVWRGSLDAGVRALADKIGYRMYVWAPTNSRPLPVAVNIRNVTVLDVFNALGTAAGRAATVTVDPQHQVVDVVHHV